MTLAEEARAEVAATLTALGLHVFERGWLSSNGMLCNVPDEPTVLIDTGYAAHAELTLALVQSMLQNRPLEVIVNTHLHSDHCGGNAALQGRYPGARTLVPGTLVKAVQAWDGDVLTYARTDQSCPRYRADAGLAHGDELRVGHHVWQVHAAPGHDPDALMLFQPTHRVLISGDALWERRLAIIFPALLHGGEAAAFAATETALDAIEVLRPALVIPGHGRPFTDVASALASSRKRLAHYRRHPQDHASHARKALVMFHMLEHQSRDEAELLHWLRTAPVMNPSGQMLEADVARDCVQALVEGGVLARDAGRVMLPG